MAIPVQMGPATHEGFTRVVQGIATGIGFIGAGEIFRDPDRDHRIHGLTSAAALWVTAALGVLAGCGTAVLIVDATAFTLLIVLAAPHLEHRDPARPGRPTQSN